MSKPQMVIAYITVSLPYGRGEAFFIPELEEMLRQGEQVHLIPRHAGQDRLHAISERLWQATTGVRLLGLRVWLGALALALERPAAVGRILCDVWSESRGLNRLRNLFVFPKALWLARLCRQRQIMHIHCQWATTTATMSMVASRLAGISWSFTAHRGDIVSRNLLAAKVSSASFVRFIAEDGFRLLEAQGLAVPIEKRRVIRMGVDLPKNAAVLRPRQAVFEVLCPANLLPVKGHKVLFKAAAQLLQSGYSLRLLIAGDGPLRKDLQALASKLKIEDQTQFLGMLPRERLLGLLGGGGIDVVVLPSLDLGGGLHEGIPVSLIEAMSFGIPVVSTATGGIPELLKDGAGIMVVPGEVGGLAAALIRIIEDTEWRLQLGRAGRMRIEEDYSVEKSVCALLSAIRSSTAPIALTAPRMTVTTETSIHA